MSEEPAVMASKEVECCLGTDFVVDPGREEDVCVDLEGEWREDSLVTAHPDLDIPNLKFVSGTVGEGGDHVNVTFRNTGEEPVTVDKERIVLVVKEVSQTAAVIESEGLEENIDKEAEDSEKKHETKENESAETVDKSNEDRKLEDPGKRRENTAEINQEDEEVSMETEEAAEKVPEEKVTDTESVRENTVEEMSGEDKAEEEKPENDKPWEDNPEEDKSKEDKSEEEKLEEEKTGVNSENRAAEVTSNETTEVHSAPVLEKSVASETVEPPKIRFVNETVEDKSEEKKTDDTEEAMETEEATEDGSSKPPGESSGSEENFVAGDEKPTLKLASFSSMATSTSTPTSTSEVTSTSSSTENGSEEKAEGCYSCGQCIENINRAIVWEAMQFCNEDCLETFQSKMSNCASCKKEVQASSMGKYSVRFGCDIKQFCSNVCLEDYKKGLKVCNYCQKDISGGEGFLAPINDKGLFKDFCQQECLQKYKRIHFGEKQDPEFAPCGVCKKEREVVQEIFRQSGDIKLCSDPCFSAYKFVNSVETLECCLCTKHFDTSWPKVYIYTNGLSKLFCSKPCQNVYIMKERKIVPCSTCKVKKYNFDMIEKFPEGEETDSNLYCSLFCLKTKPGQVKTPVSRAPLPVISAVSSLAGQLQQPVPVQTQTVREMVKETLVLPQEMVQYKNKAVMTRPQLVSKGVSCKPEPCHKETQTEGLTQPVPVPIPVPIHLPTPVKMYNAPFPVPVPIPIPFPVPVFIPTTRRSIKGIEKCIKKILNKIPADPFEAELLALAGDIAGGDDSSDSGSDQGDYLDEEDYNGVGPGQTNVVPPTDLETEMSAEKIIPKPLPVSTPDPMERQRMMQSYKRERGEESDPDDPDGAWRPKSLWEQQNPAASLRGRRPTRSRGSRTTTQATKRFRADQEQVVRQQQAALQAIQQQPKERPDANHHLKFTYGVNAWKHWVVGKNAELEKLRAQGKYQKSFETDILKLRADELNFTLCMFVKEVKKPNGDAYAADSIFYLVLGIQEYLFENTRIDNIFTDVYYDPFTSALHEVVKDFKLPVNELGYFVTRIEEEHLWESKQLGAHSPQVLLNTLVYFNTKYFQLKTVDQHLKLSFSHIMKHWKKSNMVKAGQQQRTVLLRYYPPPAKGQKNDDRKMYEQHENHETPLRCPVKLYEFYLSKCPESVKNRNDMFYLQPERSCVPDSPVWFSTQLFNRFSLEKMLSRLMMVREVQEHMLADQSG